MCIRDRQIDEEVRFAGRDIIAGKGATFYGIGSALANIVGTVISDLQSVLTVCSPIPDVAGCLLYTSRCV